MDLTMIVSPQKRMYRFSISIPYKSRYGLRKREFCMKKTSTSAPVIGFPLDHETKPTYSKLPWYALRENYFSAVSSLGAVPLGLPHEPALVETYLDMIDGLIITGGAFDVSPALYGQSSQHETVVTKDARTQFEFAMTRGALERKMPILGICGGEQLLNVVLGGTLIQHIPDSVEGALEHEQKNPRNEAGHVITVEEGTLLRAITGASALAVNTAHHQAVEVPASGVVVSARASDGVIEAIEYPAHPFCLGVQWHPERLKGDVIIPAFLKACRRLR
jgi:putative glutamine amidotransferase